MSPSLRALFVLAIVGLLSTVALPGTAAEQASIEPPSADCSSSTSPMSQPIQDVVEPQADNAMLTFCLNPPPPSFDCSAVHGGLCANYSWNCDTGCCEPTSTQFSCPKFCNAVE